MAKLNSAATKSISAVSTPTKVNSDEVICISVNIRAVAHDIWVGDSNVDENADRGVFIPATDDKTFTAPNVGGYHEHLNLSDLYFDSASGSSQIQYSYITTSR